VAFKIPYVYDHITKSCRKQAEVIHNHLNPNMHATGQGEAMHRKYKRKYNLAEVKPAAVRVSAVSEWINKLRHNLLHKPALTEVIRIVYITNIHYSIVTKCVWCP
jgi:hypothetical protein